MEMSFKLERENGAYQLEHFEENALISKFLNSVSFCVRKAYTKPFDPHQNNSMAINNIPVKVPMDSPSELETKQWSISGVNKNHEWKPVMHMGYSYLEYIVLDILEVLCGMKQFITHEKYPEDPQISP